MQSSSPIEETSPTIESVPPWLSIADACRLLGGLHRDTLRRLILGGQVRSSKVGRRRLVESASVLALIESGVDR